MRSSVALVMGVLFIAASASAQESSRPLYEASLIPIDAAAPQSPAPARVAVEYSEAYRTRAKIHKYASLASLPLFATEVALGQSVYSTPSGAKRNAHVAVGTAIGGLFAVNSVTGAWNLWEARKDPNGRKRRVLHGILMLAADAGFAATAAVAPGDDDGERGAGYSFADARSRHRTVALTSIGIGTVGYLVMLIGNR
jgi:hypothetical protein